MWLLVAKRGRARRRMGERRLASIERRLERAMAAAVALEDTPHRPNPRASA
jgi:hypothetical protein